MRSGVCFVIVVRFSIYFVSDDVFVLFVVYCVLRLMIYVCDVFFVCCMVLMMFVFVLGVMGCLFCGKLFDV